MLTWSSWPAEDVIESTEAGCARLFISDTRDAAVYWQTMNPELTPASPTRNAGRPFEVFGSRSRKSLRSEIEASPTLAAASESHASATGWPWKFPPERISPVSVEHDGIVRDRGELYLEGLGAVAHHVPEGAVDLGSAPDRVRVLDDVVARAVGRQDFAACQESHQVPSRRQLTRVRAQPHDPGVEGAVGPEDGLDGERSRDVRDLGEPAALEAASTPMAVMPCVPLMRARPSLASSTSGSRPHRRRASHGRETFASQPDLTLTDDGKSEVCQRCEVTRRTERSLFGHDGKDVRFEHLDESQHDVASDSGVAERQDVRPQRKHGPDFLVRTVHFRPPPRAIGGGRAGELWSDRVSDARSPGPRSRSSLRRRSPQPRRRQRPPA